MGKNTHKKIMYSSSPQAKKSSPFPKPKVSQGILRAKKHTSQHGCFETGFGPCESRVVEVHHPYAEHHSPWLETNLQLGLLESLKADFFFDEIIHFNRVFYYKPCILGYPYFWNTQIPLPQKISGPLRRESMSKEDRNRLPIFFRGLFFFSLRPCST